MAPGHLGGLLLEPAGAHRPGVGLAVEGEPRNPAESVVVALTTELGPPNYDTGYGTMYRNPNREGFVEIEDDHLGGDRQSG